MKSAKTTCNFCQRRIYKADQSLAKIQGDFISAVVGAPCAYCCTVCWNPTDFWNIPYIRAML